MWDAIVLGSGIGGLAAACALSRQGRRVLVLEQHHVAGGLTQVFKRQDWTFAPGVHYIGGVGPHAGAAGQFGRLLAWLTDGALEFAPSANPYDIVHLPDFEFGIAHPESAFRDALLQRFPQQHAAIDRWFETCHEARHSAFTLFSMHGMPSWMAFGLRLWRGAEVERWTQRTLGDELARIDDAKLRAVLGARWGLYGAPPAWAPFVEHALANGAYNAGAYYPVGGPARFAQTMLPVIEAAGGQVRTGCDVKRIVTEQGCACGVEFEQGGVLGRERSQHIISAMGVGNTVACLDPGVAPSWQHAIRDLAPGLTYVSLFIGLDGDISSVGASSANHWVFESEDIGALWSSPGERDAPSFFVSFPSLKDPACQGKPTAEVATTVEAGAFAPWLHRPEGKRSADYVALKAAVEQRLLDQFLRHFPALRPMVRFHELSTPLTQQHYVRSPEGAMYGLEMTAERMTTPALYVRTPLSGLLLAGQDVIGPGVPAAFMGGLMAAAAVEPSLWGRLRA